MRSYSLFSISGSKRNSANEYFLKSLIIKSPIKFRQKSQLLPFLRFYPLCKPLFIGVSNFMFSINHKLFSTQKGFVKLNKTLKLFFQNFKLFTCIKKYKTFFRKLKHFILLKISKHIFKNLKTFISQKTNFIFYKNSKQ